MATLPYVTAPGNIEKALRGIQSASTPPKVTLDFVKTILQISGGSGDQMNSFLKKIGFVEADGTPSALYKKFRNSASSGNAMAAAIKKGYAPLYARNEYMHNLSDEKLRGLIIEETGQEADSSSVSLALTAIKNLKKHANFDGELDVIAEESGPEIVKKALSAGGEMNLPKAGGSVGLNLSYTINLNLPATSDIAVFNAIFKSLKENLLQNAQDD